jgi:hypothetical protein
LYLCIIYTRGNARRLSGSVNILCVLEIVVVNDNKFLIIL